jgi:uncharacterized membrane protein
MDNFSLILHVFAATLIVGPQVLLFFAAVPATWIIEDEQLKRAVTRVITQRYGYIAGLALLTSLVTGLYQFYNVTPSNVSDDMTAYRFGWIFMAKMTLFVVFIGLLGFHGVIGRRIGRLADAYIETGDDDQRFALENMRRNSLMLSMLMMLIAIAILALGVMLGRGQFSYVPS